MNSVSVLPDGLSAGEYDAVDVPSALVWSFGTKYPGVATLQANIRLLEIEKSETQAIDTAGCCLATP